MLSEKYTARLTAALLLVGASTLPYAVQAATVSIAPLTTVVPTAGTPVVFSAQAEIETPESKVIKLVERPEHLEIMEFEASETPETH